MTTMPFLRPGWLVFGLALILLFPIVAFWGPAEPVYGDALQYLVTGQNLANGQGYRDTTGPYPDQASYARMPGWPVVLAVAVKLLPGVPPTAILRYVDALGLAGAGAFMALLCLRFGASKSSAVWAGLATALSPPLIHLAVTGMSEILFLLCLLAGWWYLERPGTGNSVMAGCLFGFCSLVRTNFVLVPVCAVALLVLFQTGRSYLRQNFRLISLVLALAYLFPLAWAVRNYPLVHRFPFLSSIEGETLYGGNNDRVAFDLENWGYWVMPDEIPGETPKLKLAQSLSDLQLNDYYHDRAMAWMRSHRSDLPRLVLGKLIRSFVPVPWKPNTLSYVAFGFRWLLILAYLLLLPFWWPRIERRFLLGAASLFAVNLVTIVLYWGVFRFTHVYVEIFFLPCIALGWEQWRAQRSGGQLSSGAR